MGGDYHFKINADGGIDNGFSDKIERHENTGSDSSSRISRNTDEVLSTLRQYVSAVLTTLHLVNPFLNYSNFEVNPKDSDFQRILEFISERYDTFRVILNDLKNNFSNMDLIGFVPEFGL